MSKEDSIQIQALVKEVSEIKSLLLTISGVKKVKTSDKPSVNHYRRKLRSNNGNS
jgi:hypothetical protein